MLLMNLCFTPRVNLTILIGFMRIYRIAILIYIVLLAQSCSLFSSSNDSSVYVKSTQIKTDFTLNNWKAIKNHESADIVFEKNKTGSLIIVNSNCRKNNLSNLQTLKASVLSGIEKIEIESEKNINLHNREALETIFTGSLDGIKRHLALTIFQRDFCIYDMIFIAKKKDHFTKDYPDYIKLSRELYNFGPTNE